MAPRWRPSRGRPVPPAPPALGPAELAESLRSLADIAARVIDRQAAAEEIIAACARPGDTPPEVARRGGRLAGELYRLHNRAVRLAAGTERGSLHVRVEQLIHYHAQLLDVCLKLAFPKYRTPALERRRLALRDLGDPAQTLRDAHTVLHLWLADLETDAQPDA